MMTIGIIGAGAIGLGCGYHLQRAGFSVELIDTRPPGMGASFGNAGIIANCEVLPLARPSVLRQVPAMLLDRSGPLVIRRRYLLRLAPWLARFALAARPAQVSRASRILARLLEQAMPAWREILAGSGFEGGLIARGWLRLLASDLALARSAPDVEVLRQLGVRVEILDRGEVLGLEPALGEGFTHALFYPDAGHLSSPLAALTAIFRTLVRQGGGLQQREIQRIETTDEQAIAIDGEGRRHTYSHLVIAAGAWSRRLVRTLGADVPLDTERGYHVMLPTPQRSLSRPVSVASPGYTLVQMEDGVRLTTGVEFGGLHARGDFRRARRLARHAAAILPGLDPAPTSEWLGMRPSMPESLPVIGPLPGNPRILLAFGHGHLGVTLGPLTGKLVAEIAGGTPSIDTSGLAPRARRYR